MSASKGEMNSVASSNRIRVIRISSSRKYLLANRRTDLQIDTGHNYGFLPDGDDEIKLHLGLFDRENEATEISDWGKVKWKKKGRGRKKNSFKIFRSINKIVRRRKIKVELWL